MPIDDWFYARTWAEQAHVPVDPASALNRLPQRWLVVGSGPFATELVELLHRDGKQVSGVPRHRRGVLEGRPEVIVHICAGSRDADQSEDLQSYWDLVDLGRALAVDPSMRPVRLVVVTRDAISLSQALTVRAADAAVAGLWRVLAQEIPQVSVTHVDIGQGGDASALLGVLADGHEPEVAFLGQRRMISHVTALPVALDRLAPPRLVPGGTYLITGGFGPVALQLARYLARRYHARLVLLGRRELPTRTDWAAVAASPTHETGDVIRAITAIEAAGGAVHPVRADVAVLSDLAAAWDEATSAERRIDGVIHAAGVSGAGAFPLVQDLRPGVVAGHFRAKLTGTHNIAVLAERHQPGFVLALSSLAAILGGLGFGAYAAANSCLEAVARVAGRSRVPWTVVRLDGWTREPGSGAVFRSRAGHLIADADADALFDRIFRLHPAVEVTVSTTDLAARAAGAIPHRTPPAGAPPTGATQHYPRPDLPVAYRDPADELEAAIAGTWAELLRLDRVGVDDDFFALGGHSLLAMQLLARLREDFGVQVPLGTVFTSPTVAGLALALEDLYLSTADAP